MDHLYSVWLQIFSEKKYLSDSKTIRMIYYSVKHLIVYLQYLQFFWYYNMPVHRFSSYSTYWKILSLASFDVIAAGYGFIRVYVYVITVFLTGTILVILLSLSFEILKKKLPIKAYSVLRVILIVFCDILYMPTILILQLAIKYTQSNYTRVVEYSDFVPASDLNFGNGSQTGFTILLTTLFLYSVFYEMSSFEIRHSIEDEVHVNKLSCYLDFLKKLLDFVTATLFLNFIQKNYELYLFILLISNVTISIYYFHSIPYYCYFMNYLKFLSSFSLALNAFFFLLGLKLDNAGVTFVLSVSSFLVLIPLCKAGMDKRYEFIDKPQTSIFFKFDKFEKSIRGYLKNGQLGERIVRKLNKNYSIHKSVLNNIVQAYYCSDILGNCTLALNKAYQIELNRYNLFECYQVYKCRFILKGNCEVFSQSFKLFKYFVEFSNIKKEDKQFCESYNQMLLKLIEKDCKLSDLKKIIISVVKQLYLLEKKYTSLLLRFPNALEIKNSYGTFLINILNDTMRGNKLVTRPAGTRYKKNLTKNILKFIADRCFAVISADLDSFGKVIFYNQNFLNFLGYTEETIKSVVLNQMIPREFIKRHDKHMSHFIENSITSTVFKNSVLGLIDSDGFLCECILNCECIGYDGSISYICAIDPLNFRRREFSMVSESGQVYAHSKSFCTLLGISNKSIENRFIQEYLESFDPSLLIENQVVYFPIKVNSDRFQIPRKIAFILKTKKIGKTVLNYLYISEDKNEISSWTNDQEFYDTDDLNGYGTKIETVITEGFEEFKEIIVKKKVKIFDREEEGEALEEKRLIENQLKSSSKSTQQFVFLSDKDIEALNKSRLVLKITKIIMMLSISFVVISNLAVLIYIASSFKSSNSLTGLTTVGDLGSALTDLLFKIRSIDIQSSLNQPKIYESQDILKIIQNLREIKNSIENNGSILDRCQSFSDLQGSEIEYWTFDSKPRLVSSTLSDFINQIIINAQVLTQSNGMSENNLIFLLVNCAGNSLNRVQQIIKKSQQCELGKIRALKTFDFFIMISGIVLIFFIFLTISGFMFLIDKDLNKVWRLLFKRMHISIISVRSKVIDRLSHFHNKSEYLEENQDAYRIKSQDVISYRHSLRYLLTISVLLVFSSAIYIINSQALNSNILNYLFFKPVFITDLIQKEIYLNVLSFYAQESTLPISLQISAESQLFSNILSANQSVPFYSSLLLSSFQLYRRSVLKDLASESVLSQIHDEIPGQVFMKCGLLASFGFIVQESFDLQNDPGNLAKFHLVSSSISNKTSEIKSFLLGDSFSTVADYINYLIIFTTVSCFLLAVLYFIIYYPMIEQELEVLRGITKILSMIPKTN